MKTQQVHPFEKVLHEQFGGVIRLEEEDGAACAVEAASVARGNGFSDSPKSAGLPNLWPLSDGCLIWPDDKTRTEHVVPMVKALWGWPQWSRKRRAAWKRRVIQRTIREVLPCVVRPLGLEAEAEHCAQTGETAPSLSALEAAMSRDVHSSEELRKRVEMGQAKTAIDFATKATSSMDPLDMALAASLAANALQCMAIVCTINSNTTDAEAARYKICGVSAMDILVLACRIWREEAGSNHRITPS